MLESYSLDRYGINLSYLWPRLLRVIPKDAQSRMEDANIYLDFAAIMTVFTFVLAAVSGVRGYYSPPRELSIQLILVAAFLVISRMMYQLAIEATRSFVSETKATVDLYRLKVLGALNLEPPSSPREEFEMWEQMRYFIAQGDLPGEPVRFKKESEGEKKKRVGFE
jgi:hypothetical protein